MRVRIYSLLIFLVMRVKKLKIVYYESKVQERIQVIIVVNKTLEDEKQMEESTEMRKVNSNCQREKSYFNTAMV